MGADSWSHNSALSSSNSPRFASFVKYTWWREERREPSGLPSGGGSAESPVGVSTPQSPIPMSGLSLGAPAF